MSTTTDKTNIYLMGYMGCGKSHVGQQLAKFSHRQHLDTDKLIEKKAKMTIPQIFEQKGEKEFRAVEKEIVHQVALLQNHIISLGGGAVMDPENWETISNSGRTITLSYPPEIIMSRLSKKENRPLLNGTQDQTRLNRIKTMLEQRQPYYQRADLVLHFNQVISVDDIAKMLLTYCGV